MSRFDNVIERRNTLSVKWNDICGRFNNEECIPMWVADMDFAPPEEVIDAFRKELEHGIFGYSYYPKSLFEAIQQWLEKRHDFHVDINEIYLNNAVLPTISMVIKALTKEGDSVLMHTPIYHPFFHITKEVNRKAVYSELVYSENKYLLDLEDFEKQIVQNEVKLFILSNPHNPGCRAWTRSELIDMVNICKKYNVLILSDEIHSDLTMPGIKHIPTSLVDKDYEENIITVMAPTKTFNLAGVKSSFYIVKNKQYQELFVAAQRNISTPELNNFAIVGTEAAYKYGQEWVDELRQYIYDNYLYLKEKLKEVCPKIKVTELEATYLVWLSFSEISKSEEEIFEILCNAGVGIQKGSQYGIAGEKYFRMNIGCPSETLKIAVNRLIDGVNELI